MIHAFEAKEDKLGVVMAQLCFEKICSTVGKKLNLMTCGARNLFGLVDDILAQGGQPTFISIARNKTCTAGSKKT